MQKTVTANDRVAQVSRTWPKRDKRSIESAATISAYLG
jgi:hypothetical protein